MATNKTETAQSITELERIEKNLNGSWHLVSDNASEELRALNNDLMMTRLASKQSERKLIAEEISKQIEQKKKEEELKEKEELEKLHVWLKTVFDRLSINSLHLRDRPLMTALAKRSDGDFILARFLEQYSNKFCLFLEPHSYSEVDGYRNLSRGNCKIENFEVFCEAFRHSKFLYKLRVNYQLLATVENAKIFYECLKHNNSIESLTIEGFCEVEQGLVSIIDASVVFKTLKIALRGLRGNKSIQCLELWNLPWDNDDVCKELSDFFLENQNLSVHTLVFAGRHLKISSIGLGNILTSLKNHNSIVNITPGNLLVHHYAIINFISWKDQYLNALNKEQKISSEVTTLLSEFIINNKTLKEIALEIQQEFSNNVDILQLSIAFSNNTSIEKLTISSEILSDLINWFFPYKIFFQTLVQTKTNIKEFVFNCAIQLDESGIKIIKEFLLNNPIAKFKFICSNSRELIQGNKAFYMLLSEIISDNKTLTSVEFNILSPDHLIDEKCFLQDDKALVAALKQNKTLTSLSLTGIVRLSDTFALFLRENDCLENLDVRINDPENIKQYLMALRSNYIVQKMSIEDALEVDLDSIADKTSSRDLTLKEIDKTLERNRKIRKAAIKSSHTQIEKEVNVLFKFQDMISTPLSRLVMEYVDEDVPWKQFTKQIAGNFT